MNFTVFKRFSRGPLKSLHPRLLLVTRWTFTLSISSFQQSSATCRILQITLRLWGESLRSTVMLQCGNKYLRDKGNVCKIQEELD